jgi:hypothetical protein
MTPVTVRFDNGFDWELLHEQKKELLELIFAEFGEVRDVPHPLDYIVAIIDEVQEQAADAGEPVVFDDDLEDDIEEIDDLLEEMVETHGEEENR